MTKKRRKIVMTKKSKCDIPCGKCGSTDTKWAYKTKASASSPWNGWEGGVVFCNNPKCGATGFGRRPIPVKTKLKGTK